MKQMEKAGSGKREADERGAREEVTGNVRLDEVLARLQAKVEAAEREREQEERAVPGPDGEDVAVLGRGADRVEATAEKPEEGVRAVTRSDPILPGVHVEGVVEHPAREAGRLAFGGLLEGRDDLAETQLPLFDRAKKGPRVAMLELADARGGPVMARGRGAPLDLRLFVAACVMTPLDARETRAPLVTSVRELRDFCFPNGWKKRRDWPAIRSALSRARDYAIPWVIGSTAGGWWPVALRFMPGRDAQLDDPVVLDVMLPPGSGVGPVIDRPELVQLGVSSAPRFRAYIAAHSVAWRPGVTRRPHPRNPAFHLWSSNPANYAVLTRADRRRLAFGAEDKKNRTRREQDAAWEDLPGVEILSRSVSGPDGHRGWQIVPAAAAEVIRRARSGEDSGGG